MLFLNVRNVLGTLINASMWHRGNSDNVLSLDVGSAEWTGTAAEDVPLCQYEILLIIF
jgi:hypothetical protein